ncbi:hypothetical protein AX16_003258 [Volvariella volvacea WC 439]|nr:hypothetical protein AX16_003258 [Volvariella volvacea WC 439]
MPLGRLWKPTNDLRRFRIMCAYTDDKPFSLDLVGAVLRQSSFIQKMVDLGWANIGYFDNPEDALVLQHAIARYHAFLDLIWSSPASFFVPTLDIDLAWHTHQLMSSKYERDCMEHVGRFVDHDDKVEETGLASGFDSTFRAWQDRFGLRYAYCGCPMPGETIGQKLSRLIQHDRDSSGSQDIPSLLLPVSNRDDSMLATHPSDHNSVFAMHQRANAESSRRERKYKNTRRREREMERHKKEQGKKKKDKEKDSALAEVLSAAAELTSSWDPAFLTPVPYQSHPAAGCAGSCGNVVYGGSSGCAAGAGGCAGSAPGGNCGGGDLGGGGDYGSSGGGGDGSGGDGGGGGGCGGGGN